LYAAKDSGRNKVLTEVAVPMEFVPESPETL
jgi:hypothetical protein